MQLMTGDFNVNVAVDPVAVANFALLTYMNLRKKKPRKNIVLHNADEIEISGMKFKKGVDF